MEHLEHFRERFGISGSTLKILAIISMTIDHFAASVLYRGVMTLPSVSSNAELMRSLRSIYSAMRAIGRPAFPIFCFLLVEGFSHTRSWTKYASRLFLFALISEIPFDYGLRGSFFVSQHQNVFFTLFIGLMVMIFYTKFYDRPLLKYGVLILGLLAGKYGYVDYGFKGVFLIEVLFLFRNERLMQIIAGTFAISWEATAPIAFLPIWLYNGKRGIRLKYFFYAFYPAHLMIFGILTFVVIPFFAS
ncbi:MAG: TraX family protein [Lachnospiraceae bacterium]|nr:conjugal transfer protein TraX [Robinsoniella sp.]MDY3766525.1 TraX family protein [Lachnospiraceae bacterium]